MTLDTSGIRRPVVRWLAEHPTARRRWRRVSRPAASALLRTTPLSSDWGYERGTPVDRYYIERFLDQQRGDIRGRVLEVKDDGYTRRYGSGVASSDVIDIDGSNRRATIVADLASASTVPDEAFDCFVMTQTLHLVYDHAAAVRQTHRMLAPGGVLLATVPALSRLVGDPERFPDYWRFTAAACERVFAASYGSAQVTVEGEGNVLAGMGFLSGIAAQEIGHRKLDRTDPRFPVLITVRAVKRST